MLTIRTQVASCNSCPFLRMEHTIYCGHPSSKTEAEVHIIHRDYLHTVPDKCPLRKIPVTQITELKGE